MSSCSCLETKTRSDCSIITIEQSRDGEIAGPSTACAHRGSSRISAAAALGLLPHDPERLALLLSAASSDSSSEASSASSAQLQAAALEALGAVLPAAVELRPAREAVEQLLAQLLGQLLHHRPELAAEVGPHLKAGRSKLTKPRG